jgi:histone H3/H4
MNNQTSSTMDGISTVVDPPVVDIPVVNGVAPVSDKKKRRWKSGTVANREIRKLQNSTVQLIPKEPFKRLVREIAASLSHGDIRFSMTSMQALQESTETFIIERFQKADLARRFAKRKTLEKGDLQYSLIADNISTGQEPC